MNCFSQIHLFENTSSNSQSTLHYQMGRFCAKKALEKAGVYSSEIGIHHQTQLPDWPRNFIGSISHTKGCAAAIVTSHKDFIGLGVDVEEIFSLERSQNLYASAFTKLEKQNFLKVSSFLNLNAYLTLIFSGRESIFKAFSNAGFSFKEKKITAIEVFDLNCIHMSFRYVVTLAEDRKYYGEGSFKLLNGQWIYTEVCLLKESFVS